MLVLSQNLVLSAAELALPEGTPLILWDNIVTSTNVEASSTETGYPASNLANPSTAQEWHALETSPGAAVEVTITTNTVEQLDAVGIARHNFGTAGIAVTIGYYPNSDNSPPEFVILAGPQVPPNDEPLLFRFTPQVLTTVVVQLAAGDEPARAAVLYCGKLLQLERGVDVQGDVAVPRFARKTDVFHGRSERGDYLGRIVRSQWLENIEHPFSHVRPDWYRTYMEPFVAAAERDTPFFYAFEPEDYPYEVIYAHLSDDVRPMKSPVTGRHKFTLKMGGITE